MGEERENGRTMRGENMGKRMVWGEIRGGCLTGKRGAKKDKGEKRWRIAEIKLVT
jgi:hypothetical protein